MQLIIFLKCKIQLIMAHPTLLTLNLHLSAMYKKMANGLPKRAITPDAGTMNYVPFVRNS